MGRAVRDVSVRVVVSFGLVGNRRVGMCRDTVLAPGVGGACGRGGTDHDSAQCDHRRNSSHEDLPFAVSRVPHLGTAIEP